jgi:hypothetical protein
MNVMARLECRHDDGSVFWASAARPSAPRECPHCGKPLTRVEYVPAADLREAVALLRDARAMIPHADVRSGERSAWCGRADALLDNLGTER